MSFRRRIQLLRTIGGCTAVILFGVSIVFRTYGHEAQSGHILGFVLLAACIVIATVFVSSFLEGRDR